MTHASSHGATSRRPVYTGNRRAPGLYERTLANGTTVYEARLRLAGRVRRHRLTATTKTDAINELRALQVDYERGEAHRSPAAGLTLDELARDYLTHLRARVHDPTLGAVVHRGRSRTTRASYGSTSCRCWAIASPRNSRWRTSGGCSTRSRPSGRTAAVKRRTRACPRGAVAACSAS